VLHLHVRELDGKGSKRLSMFNELIAGRSQGRAGHGIQWRFRSPSRRDPTVLAKC